MLCEGLPNGIEDSCGALAQNENRVGKANLHHGGQVLRKRAAIRSPSDTTG